MKTVARFMLFLYLAGNLATPSSARHHHNLQELPVNKHQHHHKKHHHGHLSHHKQFLGGPSAKEGTKMNQEDERKVGNHPPNGQNQSIKRPLNSQLHLDRKSQTTLSRNRRDKDMKHPITTSKNSKNSSSLLNLTFSCNGTRDCSNITHAFCNNTICECPEEYVFVRSASSCIKDAQLNHTCDYEEQCTKEHRLCDLTSKRCICEPSYTMRQYPGYGIHCVSKDSGARGTNVDPGVIGAVVGLGLMFVIICVVLRMFSKERFRENRSIFNTPNPRLMNASLFKESKLLTPARGERRGSRASVRGPSRASSIASVNKECTGKSPNGSITKGRRGSALSTVSATGSASGAAGATAPKAPSPNTKDPPETSVAIEAVD